MADPIKPILSLDEIAKTTSVDFNQFTNAGKTFKFDPKGADRFLTYGSEVYGQLGYNPFANNEKKYQQITSWTKDISRGYQGMLKLSNVGLSDTFAFGAFGNTDNHKDFGKIMQDYGSQREGLGGFFSNTMLSAGYTVGIIAGIAAEELALAGVTALSGGTAGGATIPLMGAEIARGASLLSKANKALKTADSAVGVFGWMKNIDNARWYKEAVDSGTTGIKALGSLSRGVGGFGKAVLPLGNTLDFIRSADKIKDLNGLTKMTLGAASLARDARKFYLAHSEADLEAKFVKDEIETDAIAQWHRSNPGQVMPDSVRDFIKAKAQKSYNKTYETNFGLIYLTNAITFEGLLKGFSPTNKLFGMVDNFAVSGKGSRGIVVEAITPTVKNYIKKKASELTIGKFLGGTVRASMEGVQEYGQDVIASAAKKYGDIKFEIIGYQKDAEGKLVKDGSGNKIPIYGKMITNHTTDMSRGAYWSQIGKSLGDSNIETFMSGALMGIFASPVNFATQVVSEYTFGERGFGSNYNAWTAEGRKNYKNLFEERKEIAKFLTEFSKKQGVVLEADISSPVHRMIGLREKMLEAARNGDQKFFEDNKAEIFRLGMRSMFKTGMHTELIDHLDQMLNHSAKELNESLDRIDITEENKEEWYGKIRKRKADILKLKEEYDRIEEEMPSKGTVDAVMRNESLSAEEKQEYVLDILAWDQLKEEMLFTGDKVRNLAERKNNIKADLKKNTNLTDLELAALTNAEDLAQQIDQLEQQVESNKEYKLDNTKEHQKALIKLQALKDLQTSLERFNNPTFDRKNATSVQKEYDAMEDAFARYMLAVNTELNSIPEASALSSDKNLYQRYKKRFAPIFDFYKLDEESKQLEYYADLLNNPQYSSQWMRANREMLVEFGKNKQAYIEKAIEAWQTREVSDDMMNELLENGIIFELDELDDLYKKGIMPSTLFDIEAKTELSPEKYKQAVKIIEKYYKKLTGKKLVGAKVGVRTTREKSKTDKRRAATIIKQYVGSKNKNVPVPIVDFINNMLAYGNRYLAKSEIEILKKLQEFHATNPNILKGNVILTDEAESPVSFNEEGDLVLDVRFGAFDFAKTNYEINGVKYYSVAQLDKAFNSNKITENQYNQGVSELRATPFEYVAISGIVQNIFVDRVNKDEELRNNITTLMNLAKISHIENLKAQEKNEQELRLKTAQAEISDIFNNPLVFITEAYANRNFQYFLSNTVNSTDVKEDSLWKNLNRELRNELGANGIKGSLLDSILGITQLNIAETEIEDVVESGPIVETEETEIEEEVITEEEELPEGFRYVEEGEILPAGNYETRLSVDGKKTITNAPKKQVKETVEEPKPAPVNLKELANRRAVINQKIKKLQQDINGINSEINRTSSLKFRRISKLNKEKAGIQEELQKLIDELKAIETQEKSVTETPIAAKPDLKPEVLDEEDEDGNQVITSRSKFENLPLPLQLQLARSYINSNKVTAPFIPADRFAELQDRDKKDVAENVQGFLQKPSDDQVVALREAIVKGFNVLAVEGDEKALDYLSEEQLKELEDLMSLPSFLNIIGEYNKNAGKTPSAAAPIEETEEEDEEDLGKLKSLMLSQEAIDELNSAKQRALDNIQETFTTGARLFTTTFVDHLGNQTTITEYTRTALEAIINETYSENGWANNINDIVGKEVQAVIGDVSTELTMTIDKVQILRNGEYRIYATRSDLNKRYDITVNPTTGRILTFTEFGTGLTSEAKDKLNRIIDFDKYTILPFEPNRSIPPAYQSPIQSREELQYLFPDINLTSILTEDQLVDFTERFTKVTSIEEFKNLAKEFDEAIEFATSLEFNMPRGKGETIDEGEVTESTFTAPIDFSTLKTEDELRESSGVSVDEFENTRQTINYNWNYLNTDEHVYEGDNAAYKSKYSKWKINNRDISYLRSRQIGIFGLEHLEFVDAVLNYLSEGSRRAETVNKFNIKGKSISDVENFVRIQLNNAAQSSAITSELVNALNKKLNGVGSNLTIAWKETKRMAGNYRITAKTKAQIDAMQEQLNKPQKEKKLSKKEQALLLDVGIDVQGIILQWFINGGKISSDAIQSLFGNRKSLKGPKIIKGEVSSRLSYIDNKNGETLKETAKIIWESGAVPDELMMNITDQDIRDGLEYVISSFTNTSQMIDYLLANFDTPSSKEETDEEREARERKEAEEEELFYLNKFFEEESIQANKVQQDFEASTIGQILNGTFKGKREDLTNDVERRAYDEIYGTDTTKKPEPTDEFEDFIPKTEIAPIVRKIRDYDTEKIPGANSTVKVASMFNTIRTNPTFEDIVYIYLALTNTNINYSTKQKSAVESSIVSRLASFGSQIFSPSRTISVNEFTNQAGQVIAKGVYEITPINTNTETLVRFGLKNQLTDEVFLIEGITDLFNNITDIYEPGTVINTNPIDLSLNNNDVELIKTSFTDFFSNFNNSMSEFENTEEVDLRSQIAEQFKTCK